MQASKTFKALLVSSALFLLPTLVWAETYNPPVSSDSNDYQEVTYDDLVNELSAKKKALVKKEKSPFDDVGLHAGVGYANSLTNLSTHGESLTRDAAGVEVSVGMDLFSPNWYAEGLFRNYGVNTSGNESMTLREFDLEIGYTDKLEGIWSYDLSTGLANRFLSYSDSSKNISVDEVSPNFIVSTGLRAQLIKNLSLGANVSAATAMIGSTADKNSFDFAFRLNMSL